MKIENIKFLEKEVTYLSKINFLEKYSGLKSEIRQDLLGSCAKTVLYILYLYKNRIKTLFKGKEEDFDGYIIIPLQGLVRNKLVGKTIFYNTKNNSLKNYVLGIYLLGIFQLTVDDTNIKHIYNLLDDKLRHATGIEKLYKRFLEGYKGFKKILYGNIFSSVTYKEDTKELVLKVDNKMANLVVEPIGDFSIYTWSDLSKFSNFFSIKLYLELLKKYKLNNGIYSIKFRDLKDMFNLNIIGNEKIELSSKKRDFNKFYLKPFIKKINSEIKSITIQEFYYTNDLIGEPVLNIRYTNKRKTKNNLNNKMDISSPSPIHPSLYTTLDHHKVRSRAEAMIDDCLFHHNIRHIYEKKMVINGKTIVCDFYLPDYNVYIEFWGMDNDSYLKRKEEKIKFYKENNLKLIGLENKDLNNLDESLLRKLETY